MRMYCSKCGVWRDQNTFHDTTEGNRVKSECKLCSESGPKLVRRQKKVSEVKIRICLKCEKQFESSHENRICQKCKGKK
jgi:hypothetical protein